MEILEKLVSAWKLQKKHGVLYFADPKSLPRLHTTATPGPTPVRKKTIHDTARPEEEEINEYSQRYCSHHRTHVRVSERNVQDLPGPDMSKSPAKRLIHHPG